MIRTSIHKKIGLTFFLAITFLSFGQKNYTLKGRIAVDVLEIEPIHIVNLTKEIGVINDSSGYFEIKADPGDRIIFSSVQFRIKKLVVTNEDLQKENFQVFLESLVNELDTVNISQYSLSGDINVDIEKIPTYEDKFPLWNATDIKRMGFTWADDAQSPVKNLALENGNSQATVSMDLGILINLISGAFKKKPKEIDSKIQVLDFYKEEFFIKELKIPETEFYNFLDFLDEETGIKFILRKNDSLHILEFLIHQSKKFKLKYGVKE